MAFNRNEVSALLCQCHRRCCICHRFCGFKIETDHIDPKANEGNDDIENAIPVCFECHAEIHCYNNDHPRGRKYLPEELRLHRKQWLDICKNSPEALVGAIRSADVGPLQALIDELEFNETVAGEEGSHHLLICRFHDRQFLRAIQDGAISLLNESTKSKIFDAYYAVGHANGEMEKVIHHVNIEQAIGGSKIAIQRARSLIRIAKEELLTFLSHAGNPETTASAIDEGT